MGAHSNLGVFEDSSVTTGGVTQARFSTNFIDLGVTVPKIGVGQHAPYLCIRTASAPTDTNDSLSIELLCSATNGGTNLSGTIKSVGMPLAGVTNNSGVNEILATDERLLTAGSWMVRQQLPYDLDLRYVQLYYNNTISGGRFLFDAWLSDGPASDFRGSQVINSNVGQP